MNARASHLVSALQLTPHPEGGYFREVYRATTEVRAARGATRAASTLIYFLLTAGDVSRWHRVASDEVWHFYEGEPLELWRADSAFVQVERLLLGPLADSARPVQIIPAGEWQAARSTGAYTLVGCTVAPGFDFADFELLDAGSATADLIRSRHPHLSAFV